MLFDYVDFADKIFFNQILTIILRIKKKYVMSVTKIITILLKLNKIDILYWKNLTKSYEFLTGNAMTSFSFDSAKLATYFELYDS